jgi:hypothetical protein
MPVGLINVLRSSGVLGETYRNGYLNLTAKLYKEYANILPNVFSLGIVHANNIFNIFPFFLLLNFTRANATIFFSLLEKYMKRSLDSITLFIYSTL